MRRHSRRLCLSVMLFVATGCVREATHPLGRDRLGKLRKEMNGRLADVSLEPAANQEPALWPLSGRVFIEKEMVKVVESQELVHRHPLAQVREIDANHVGRGFGLGALAGAITGGLAGGVLGWVVGPECEGKADRCGTRGGTAVAFGVFLGLPTAMVGGLIGALVGAGPVWRFTPAPAP